MFSPQNLVCRQREKVPSIINTLRLLKNNRIMCVSLQVTQSTRTTVSKLARPSGPVYKTLYIAKIITCILYVCLTTNPKCFSW